MKKRKRTEKVFVDYNDYKDRPFGLKWGTAFAIDELNKVILILYLIVALLFYFQEHLLWLMLMITFGSFYVFRSLSKDIFARSKENQQYLNLKNKVLSFFSQDKLSHKQFICPDCKQKVRVPSGRGKIEITCPKCHHKFTKRS